ncbi:MAG: hypothetical protein IPH59_00245 [bacterium]|nr:hypothetical protein [bacterium]
MKRLFIVALFALLPSLVSAQDFSLFDSAMAQVGLTSEDISFDQDEMATWGGDTWRLSYFTMFHKNPLKLPKYGLMNLESFKTECGNITALVANAGRKIDCPVRRSLIGDPLEQYARILDSLPQSAWSSNQKSLAEPQFAKLRSKIDLLYALIDDDKSLFTSAFDDVEPNKHRRQIFDYFLADSQSHNDLVEDLATTVDFNRMIGGAEDIAEALRRLSDSLEYCAFPDSRQEFPTKHGLIVIGTANNDEYSFQSPPLLILDPGGNDTYRISGFPVSYPLSAVVDVDGNDLYISADSTFPGIGGAVLGMSVVIDKSGNDYYDAKNVAQGCGIFGVGVVMDNSGRDTYRAKTYTQGAAAFGAGVFSDSTGNDSLYCWMNSQGFGYTMGCGFCINYSGDDVYIAEDSILFSPGQQTQEHNSSLSQGVGFGKRADYIDGHSWAGGVGILCDVSGADKYSAGLFAQGCGYWFALGMLLDGAGDDDYYSAWYTIGSGAHFAIGYLDDFAGNDRYNATMNMSIGSGHDFNIGYFNERSGNDTYLAPGLSLGGGNFQGIGIFHDWLGDDNYTTIGGFNLGGARGLVQGARAYLRTFGVFVDGGGNDTYSEPRVSNSLRWISPKSDSTKADPFEIGVGIDK